MPRPKTDFATKKINFFGEDWGKLKEMFPEHGPSVAVRQIVHAYVKQNYKESTPLAPSEVGNVDV